MDLETQGKYVVLGLLPLDIREIQQLDVANNIVKYVPDRMPFGHRLYLLCFKLCYIKCYNSCYIWNVYGHYETRFEW